MLGGGKGLYEERQFLVERWHRLESARKIAANTNEQQVINIGRVLVTWWSELGYEAQTLLLNDVSVLDTLIGVDTRRTFIGEVFNSKNICWIFENSSTVLTQYFKRYKYNNFLKTQIYCINFYYDYKNK